MARTPLRTNSTSAAAVAARIRELITDHGLVVGDRLPSERDLGDRLGVSRVTVREALHRLKGRGLVTIRVGRGGGTFVSAPTESRMSTGLSDLVQLWPVTAEEIVEARRVLELRVLALAVVRATATDIADLTAMAREHEAAWRGGRYHVGLSADFHVRVAACTHNAAIESLVRSFRGPLQTSVQLARRSGPIMGRLGPAEHRLIVEAMARRDADAACALMDHHLERTARSLAGDRTHGPASSPDR
jgi:GntR family transcriptional regulator, transcriptional repressor for pyruvate dehydrogenase complex